MPKANFCKRSYLNEDQVAPVSRGLRSTGNAHQIEGVATLILTGGFIGYLPEGLADIWVRQDRMRTVGDVGSTRCQRSSWFAGAARRRTSW